MDAHARSKMTASATSSTRPNATAPAPGATARQAPPYRPNGGVGAAAQETGPAISSWRLARDAVARKLSPSTENVSPKGTTLASGAGSAASRTADPRKFAREGNNLGRVDERPPPPSAGVRASTTSDGDKGYFSRAAASAGQSALRENVEKRIPSKVDGTVKPPEEKMAARSSRAGRDDPTTNSARGYGSSERPSGTSAAHGRPFSWTRPGESTRGEDHNMHSLTRESLGGGRGVPQAFSDGRVDGRNEIVHGPLRGRMSQRPSLLGTPYVASRINAPRARSQPVPSSRSQPLENEDLIRFLGAYGTPPRRSTGVFPLQQMDRQSRDAKEPLIPSYSPYPTTHRSLYAATPPANNTYQLLDAVEYDTNDSSKLLEDELSSLLSGLEAYQKRLERAALVVSLERQRRRRY
ncbi:uncharacterized protein Tco025E_02602 [Trypanosoma conorhini]|uniref:Uncharacterized protein n=1 Tax=Trypanosoma conorhini TaxID=83891 RepID=A0A422Q283_9TRYP|nr:uncharacterized protein Tco025E_02602 [Trypanosoma conorhini]RNF24083.1 hypothetical protein Tco025E_02602 [Trypanosoma conorhini]